MKEQLYLLNCLAEECSEVIQRVTKIMRFGIDEVQTGQELTNRDRLVYEFNDILGIIELLKEQGLDLSAIGDRTQIEKKKDKVKFYMEYSKEQGVL